MKTVALHTVGCKLNRHETNDIERQFSERGWRPVAFGEPADVVVVNTCTVTVQSDSRCRAALRKARRESPGATVIATGCFAQAQPGAVAGMPEVDLVLGNREKERIFDHLDAEGRPRPARSRRGGARRRNEAGLRAGHRLLRADPGLRENPGRLRRRLRVLHRPAGARAEPQPPRRRRPRPGDAADRGRLPRDGAHGRPPRRLGPRSGAPADPRRTPGPAGRAPGAGAAAPLVHRADGVHPRTARPARGVTGHLPAPAHPASERVGRRPPVDAPPLRAGVVRAGRRAARRAPCPTPASARMSSPASPASGRRTSSRASASSARCR